MKKIGILLGLVLIAVPVIALACPSPLQLNVTAVGSCVEGSPAYSVTATATQSYDGWTLQGITGAPASTQSYSVTATWTKVNTPGHWHYDWVRHCGRWYCWYEYEKVRYDETTYYTETRNVSGTIPTQVCDFDVTICYQGITQTVKNSALDQYPGYVQGACVPTTEPSVNCAGVYSVTTTENVPAEPVLLYAWVDPFATETVTFKDVLYTEPSECLKTHCEPMNLGTWYECNTGNSTYTATSADKCWCGGLTGRRHYHTSYDCGQSYVEEGNWLDAPKNLGYYSAPVCAIGGWCAK